MCVCVCVCVCGGVRNVMVTIEGNARDDPSLNP